MKLYAKIIIYAVLVFSMAILFSGYLLITYSYENAISREIDRALNQYQYDKFTVQAEMITNTELFQKGISQNDIILRRLSADLSGQTAFFSEDQTLLFSELPVQTDFSIINMVSNEVIIHQFQTVNDKSYLMICGKLTQSGISIYLLIATDISSVITQRKMMVQSFVQVYFITLALSIVLIMILSAFLTKPINRMTKIANRISSGHYHERLSISRGDEIGELAKSFNDMADAVEDKINELSENSRQKEEFVASFAHELKTPLTSIIGYSDMLYQKNLPPEDIKNAAWYILSEGLRLETLSLKLMDLIVLNRQEFVMEEISADEFLQNIILGLKPLLDEKNVTVYLESEDTYIKIEYDLFKTLLLNLIDNSIKAGSNEIWISGKKNDNNYCIDITDNGRGIPVSELDRITEAFYTVDKSRSRKQHGIGLGLTLAAKIAEIHGNPLKFSSEEGVGTVVKIILDYTNIDFL